MSLRKEYTFRNPGDTRLCCRCSEQRTLDLFTAHPNYCRPCWREYQREYYRTKDRERSIARAAKWNALNPDARRAARRRHYAKHREKIIRKTVASGRESGATRAHNLVFRAVRRGELTRPEKCPKCGVAGKIQAHHHLGYDRPLDVEWLCKRCHSLEHAHMTPGVLQRKSAWQA